MKIRHYITFNIPNDVVNRIRHDLMVMGLGTCFRAPPNERGLASFERTFDSTEPQLESLRALIRREELRVFERTEHIHTDDELRLFPLLQLFIGKAEIDPFGPQYGTTYDFTTGCAACGTGATQTSPFFAPPSAFPKSGDICSSTCEEFVSTRIADALKSSGIGGMELRQVVASTTGQSLPWWQIICTFEMPRFSEKTRGVIRGDPPPCSVCNRDGHFQTIAEPSQLIYDSRDIGLQQLPHLARTWECYAKSWADPENPRRRRIANPKTLVTPLVFDLFRRLKVKHATFQPVRIE